jgi:hypothetical protein
MDKPIYQRCYECLIAQMIRSRAFEIWEWRMETETPGDALSDWTKAETEVLEKIAGGYSSLR